MCYWNCVFQLHNPFPKSLIRNSLNGGDGRSARVRKYDERALKLVLLGPNRRRLERNLTRSVLLGTEWG